jgi:hypothetical protein
LQKSEKLDAYGLEVHTESPEYFANVIRRDMEAGARSRATTVPGFF